MPPKEKKVRVVEKESATTDRAILKPSELEATAKTLGYETKDGDDNYYDARVSESKDATFHTAVYSVGRAVFLTNV